MRKPVKTGMMFLCILFWGYIPSFAAETSINALVIDSYSPSVPWTLEFNRGLQEANELHGGNIQYFIEYMDSSRIQSAVSDEQWVAYLRNKYANTSFQMILGDSNFASDFIRRNRDYFGREIPIVYYSNRPIEGANDNEKLLTADIQASVAETIGLALAQNPQARNIYLVRGYKYDDEQIVAYIQETVKKKPNLRLSIIYAQNLPSLLAEVRRVPKDSVLLYSLVMWDGDGNTHIPRDVLAKITRIAPVPAYTFWISLLGSGTVGGDVIDAKLIARQMVDAGMEYREKRAYSANYPCSAIMLDWKAMEKHSIRMDRAPKGAVVINRRESLWAAYKTELLALAAALAFLLFIVIFIWDRRVHKLNRRLKELNAEVMRAKELAESEARTDALTGLSNRRDFFEKGKQICSEIKRLQRPMSLLMLDIDNFKSVNDKYGHEAGDVVIKNLAKIITEEKREADVAVRFGGEEFVVVAPFTDEGGALLLAERIREKAERSVTSYGEREIRFTVSVGVFSAIPNECSLDYGLKNADDAMYRAKKQGKNRVCA